MPPRVAEAVQLRLADPGVVVDRDLAHAELAPERLEDHLRGELHPGRVQIEGRERVLADGAHPAVRVGDLDAEEDVQQARQDRVADMTVEPRHRLAVDGPLEARSHHEVVTLRKALDERREVLHRIRLVGVAHHDEVALRDGEPGEVGAAVAGALLADDGRTVLRCDFGGAVGRRVVDDDHLARASGAADALERLVDDLPDRLFLVQAGDDDGYLGRGGGHRVRRSTVARASAGPSPTARVGWRGDDPREARSFAPVARSSASRELAEAAARAVVRGGALPCTGSCPRAPARKRGATCRATCSSTRSSSTRTSSSRTRCSRGRRARRSWPARCSRPGPLVGRGRRRGAVRALRPRVVLRRAPVRRRCAAVATAAALLLYPGYVLLFHELASDAVFAAAFALVAARSSRARARGADGRPRGGARRGRRAARPRAPGRAGTPAARPRAARRAATWRGRAIAGAARPSCSPRPPAPRAGAATTACGSTTSRSCAAAGRRSRSSARSSRTASSSRRTACVARSSPSAVARELLPNEPYRSLRDRPRRRSSPPGAAACTTTSIVLADRTWGWDDDYRHLARVGREAVRAHPAAYARGVAQTSGGSCCGRCTPPVEDGSESGSGTTPMSRASTARRRRPPGADRGRADPVLARGAVHLDAGRADPRGLDVADGAPRSSSPTRPTRRARRRSTGEVDAASRRAAGPCARPGLVRWLNAPRAGTRGPFMWLAVGLVALAWRRPRGAASRSCSPAPRSLVDRLDALAVYAVARVLGPGRAGVRAPRHRGRRSGATVPSVGRRCRARCPRPSTTASAARTATRRSGSRCSRTCAG